MVNRECETAAIIVPEMGKEFYDNASKDSIFKACMNDKVKVIYAQSAQNYIKESVDYDIHAYYVFEYTTQFWEQVFAAYGNEGVPSYVQYLYLGDMNWKLRKEILFPYHYDSEKFKQAIDRIRHLVDQIEDVVILTAPDIDKYHRHYFINLKTANDIQIQKKDKRIIVTNHGTEIFSTDKVEIVLYKFMPQKGKIPLRAFLKSPIFSYVENPSLYLVMDENPDKCMEVSLRESSWDYYKVKVKTNHFYYFETEIDMDTVNSFAFKVNLAGTLYDTSYIFMPEAVFTKKRREYHYGGKCIKHNEGVIKITTETEVEKKAYEKKARAAHRNKKDWKIWVFRNLLYNKLKKQEKIWLYSDSSGVGKDNGYYQFIHDYEKQDGVKRYYVVNGKINDVSDRFIADQKKALIEFGSRKHKLLYLQAEKIITAYIEKYNYRPLTREELIWYGDLSAPKELIYLQHGVLHCHMPWKYSMDRLYIDKEVISTAYEYHNFIDNYCFSDKNLIPCGMPRYAHLDAGETVSETKILYAPSWRDYLIGKDENGKWITREEEFVKSKFYKEIDRFLNSLELEELLEKANAYLDFKLHPIFVRYAHLFKIHNSRVSIAGSTVEESSYKVFMTDFSSFVFDFVYLKKPVIYFVPDEELIRAGMSTYRELDLPLEEAFGEVTFDSQSAVAALGHIIDNGCEALPEYARKMDGFFLHYDNKQMDRLYEALMG